MARSDKVNRMLLAFNVDLIDRFRCIGEGYLSANTRQLVMASGQPRYFADAGKSDPTVP
jgi:hypothetical protein